MPAENRVWRRNGRDARQQPAAEAMAQFGKASPLVVIKRSRRPPSRAFSTRFSSRRNAMTSSCSR
jgi:hypothetical protein